LFLHGHAPGKNTFTRCVFRRKPAKSAQQRGTPLAKKTQRSGFLPVKTACGEIHRLLIIFVKLFD